MTCGTEESESAGALIVPAEFRVCPRSAAEDTCATSSRGPHAAGSTSGKAFMLLISVDTALQSIGHRMDLFRTQLRVHGQREELLSATLGHRDRAFGISK